MIRKLQMSRLFARRQARRRLLQFDLYGNDNLIDAL